MILSRTDPASVATCVKEIRAGGLIGLPTETVYGLGADASNDVAVAKIFQAKGRPQNHPLIVHISDQDGGLSGAEHFATKIPEFARLLMLAFWPGPLTLILPRREGVGRASAGGQQTIGLRCPDHFDAQAILHGLRSAPGPVVWGVAAPSANQFGRVSPTTAAHVESEMGTDLLILDGGPCSLGIESTIVDCSRGVPVLLRPGSMTAAQIEAACGQALRAAKDMPTYTAAPRASGTLESHYAPRAKVCLLSKDALKTALQNRSDSKTKPVKVPIGVYVRSFTPKDESALAVRQMPMDAERAAYELFAVLRDLDAHNVAEIWVESVPNEPLWAGVADRLQRASS